MTDGTQPPIAAPATPAPPAPPANAAEAATRLDQLKQDPKWTEALMRGGPAQTQEFHSLHEVISKGDNIDVAMSGVLPPGIIQDGAAVEMRGTAELLQTMGFTPLMIRETLSGKEATQAEVDMATKWKADHFSNAEWVKRLMSGDVEARRHLLTANIILNSPIEKKGKA
jgi:hypothetical protein